MKKAYYYLFFKLYRFSADSSSNWLSDWKASLALDVLLLFMFSSLVNFYKVFLNPNSHLGEDNLLLVVVLVISVINYFIFHHKGQWKEIVIEFDRFSEQKNKIGSWFVLIFVILVIIIFILSFNLYYKI